MQVKSIRQFILLLAGPCLLVVVAALVLYGLFSSARTQQTVGTHTRELLEGGIDARLAVLADAEAGRIQRELEHALTLATQLADTNALMGQQDASGRRALTLSRRELSNLVRQTVIENPSLLDAFIGWEPDAFGRDALYADLGEAEGYDGSGRFMPWWYRANENSVEVLPLGGTMESETPLASGVREGEYYLCPRETLAPCIIDPAPYDYGGETLLVTSFNVPIVVDGEFRGVAGVDLALDFIQDLLVQANLSLYDGAGEMALIAGRGGLVAHTGDTGRLGAAAQEAFSGEVMSAIERAREQGTSVSMTRDGMLERYRPFTIGDSEAPWTLLIRLPEQAVMGDLALQDVLQEQRRADTLGMALVGLVLAALGLAALWWVGTRVSRPLRLLAERMREIATGNGDLTQRLPVRGRDEGAELATQFNAFVDKIHDVLLDVRDSSESVRLAASEIASGGEDLSRRTEQAAASLQQTSASMEEISATVEHTSASSREANGLSKSAADVAQRSGETVGQVVETMSEISQASGKIGEIVKVIDGIAFQTNLLALNASVEAARAGEHGRGFAVVAGEVRQLATRSAEASRDIRSLIEASTQRVVAGTELVGRAGETMGELMASVNRVASMLNEISVAAREQSDGIGQVSVAVADLDRMTQQNAALVEESTTAAERLSEQADRLARVVGGFTLRDNG
ncbi:methyl-accepting chemotaxis protein [Billgrantia saliphila]|uniref:methyl-accepting chemotaxis protein n=1 Tax=Billgrantia saliphila TaxID=1848458 RepID=UPI000CE2D3D1|nr:methyl-accepting chemotaxis protein [Halomonas saliphila]